MADDLNKTGQDPATKTDDATGGDPTKNGKTPAGDSSKGGEGGAGRAAGMPVTFTSEQQAHIDKLVGERLERAQKKWEADQQATAEKAKAEAERQRLKEQEEYKTLAEKAEAQVAELEPFKASAERYLEALNGYLEKERAGLPDHILSLLDAMDAPEQLAWITKNREAVIKPAAPNIDAQASGKGKKSGDDDQLKRRFGL
jgi:hypothetical protein